MSRKAFDRAITSRKKAILLRFLRRKFGDRVVLDIYRDYGTALRGVLKTSEGNPHREGYWFIRYPRPDRGQTSYEIDRVGLGEVLRRWSRA